MAETCRAAVFNGDGTYDVREFPVPEPPDGGAVLRLEAVVTGAAGDELRLETARAIGAHHVVDVTNEDPVETVRELTDGQMADVVMDVSPVKQTVPLCLDLVRFRGRILLAGLKHNAPVDGLVTDKIVVGGLQVFGGSGFTPESMARAVELVDTGAVDTRPLRGEVFGLDGIDEAFALLSRRDPGRDAVRVTLAHSTASPA